MKQAPARVDGHGRIVIPAEYRRALNMKEGEPVAIRLEEGAIRIFTLAEGIRRAQALVTSRTKGRSLVDELIAERRAEAERE